MNIKILKTKVQGPRIAKILRFLTMKNSISLKIVNICWSLHHKASQLAYLGWVLLCFEAFSGLRIYFERSTILPVGRVEDPGSLAIELGYELDSLPTSYLGLPLGVGINLLKFWRLLRRDLTRNEQFGTPIYCHRGRITLIQRTLSNMPIYLLSIFWIPRVLCWRLEQIQREKKIHNVSWKTVCLNTEKGGWGSKVSPLSINHCYLDGAEDFQQHGTLWKTIRHHRPQIWNWSWGVVNQVFQGNLWQEPMEGN